MTQISFNTIPLRPAGLQHGRDEYSLSRLAGTGWDGFGIAPDNPCPPLVDMDSVIEFLGQ
jgi:hypothetical protein